MGLTHELSNVAEISGVSPADLLAAPRYFFKATGKKKKELQESRDSLSRDGEAQKTRLNHRGKVVWFFYIFF